MATFCHDKECVQSANSRHSGIHFDIHMNMNYFTNHAELTEKLRNAIEKNRKELFGELG